MDQGIGDFTPCSMEIPPYGAARDAQGCCCFLLLESLQIDQFQEFKFLGKEENHLLPALHVALRGITPDRTLLFNLPVYTRPAPRPNCFRALDFILHCIHRITGIDTGVIYE
jgi:hypothetical protein